MAKLVETASRLMDLYFQDYPDRKEFMTLDDFKFHIGTAYSAILNARYQEMRKEGKRETGYSAVEINPQWLLSEVKDEIKHDPKLGYYYIETDNDIFSFDFDAFGNGLNNLRSQKNECQLKKISINELEFLNVIPKTPDVWYYIEGKRRIVFTCKPCAPLVPYYVPALTDLSDTCTLSDGMVSEILPVALQLLLVAKKGTVIHQVDDGNRNSVIEQQVNH